MVAIRCNAELWVANALEIWDVRGSLLIGLNSVTTGGAVAAHFQSGDDDMEPAIALDLSLQAIEQIALNSVILPHRRHAMWIWSLCGRRS